MALSIPTLATTSPYTQTKSPVSRPFWSISRMASPIEWAAAEGTISTLKGEVARVHLLAAMYASTCSVWLPQQMKTSSTPAFAKNSRVYSISGVLASGSRHRGRSSVKGSNLGSKESARIYGGHVLVPSRIYCHCYCRSMTRHFFSRAGGMYVREPEGDRDALPQQHSCLCRQHRLSCRIWEAFFMFGERVMLAVGANGTADFRGRKFAESSHPWRQVDANLQTSKQQHHHFTSRNASHTRVILR
jgi:hypothetical protein